MNIVLQQAGSNRKELEKVLKHYGKNPVDSLKLRAAEFLIINMPGKYSEYYDSPWNDVATVYLRWTSVSNNRSQILDTYQLDSLVRKDDLKHITADYLINNIELAFEAWQVMPWNKNINFDIFCEEILPYRLSTEPLENWRGKALAIFDDLYQSLKNDTTGITPIEACCKVNDMLPRFKLDKDYPPMSFSQLMATTRGTCEQMAALAIFVMRAMGIPVTNDFSLLQQTFSTGHSWNSVNDGHGLHHYFMGTETNPGEPHIGPAIFKGKVYRKAFGNQRHVNFIKNNEKLHGTVLGTPGLFDSKPENVFDNNVYTFFSTDSVSSPWVGLDFGEPIQVSKIRYLPFTLGNSIYQGHQYELFFWNGEKWLSLGIQTATGCTLQYTAPVNALLKLENVTTQKAGEIPFFMKGGVQRWND